MFFVVDVTRGSRLECGVALPCYGFTLDFEKPLVLPLCQYSSTVVSNGVCAGIVTATGILLGWGRYTCNGGMPVGAFVVSRLILH